MSQPFSPGDFLIFQLESGFGLIRVLAVEGDEQDRVWHINVYEELFPDVETAERALEGASALHLSKPHLALTDRAFERTPAAKLANAPLSHTDLAAYAAWREGSDRHVFDRSLLLLLGMR